MATIDRTDEKDLLLRLQDGDHAAFQTLYHRYAQSLYRKLASLVKQPEEADEILQELFVKVWEKRAQIEIQASFEAYLYRVAQRMAVDYFRSLQTRSRLHAHLERAAPPTTESAEDVRIAHETQSLVEQAIARLPEQRRRAFTLCKIEGKSHREAAEIMGISPNTVHNHLVHAVSNLRAFLGDADPGAARILLLFSLFFIPH